MAQAMAEHEGLVHWVVRRQWSGGLGYNEALQLGRIGLWKALQHYDPAQGHAFSTYATPAIARTIWRGVVEARPDPGEALTSQPPQAAPDLDEQAQAALVRQALYRLVAALPRRMWRAVIVAHYGLDGHPAQTLAELAQARGVTPQRIQYLHREALLWLAHPAHSLALRRLLERNTIADYRAYQARQWRFRRARRRQR
jgi:RNA polymerase sigma factor (sigma-70 family)